MGVADRAEGGGTDGAVRAREEVWLARLRRLVRVHLAGARPSRRVQKAFLDEVAAAASEAVGDVPRVQEDVVLAQALAVLHGGGALLPSTRAWQHLLARRAARGAQQVLVRAARARAAGTGLIHLDAGGRKEHRRRAPPHERCERAQLFARADLPFIQRDDRVALGLKDRVARRQLVQDALRQQKRLRVVVSLHGLLGDEGVIQSEHVESADIDLDRLPRARARPKVVTAVVARIIAVAVRAARALGADVTATIGVEGHSPAWAEYPRYATGCGRAAVARLVANLAGPVPLGDRAYRRVIVVLVAHADRRPALLQVLLVLFVLCALDIAFRVLRARLDARHNVRVPEHALTHGRGFRGRAAAPHAAHRAAVVGTVRRLRLDAHGLFRRSLVVSHVCWAAYTGKEPRRILDYMSGPHLRCAAGFRVNISRLVVCEERADGIFEVGAALTVTRAIATEVWVNCTIIDGVAAPRHRVASSLTTS
mmetsp:Transcript_24130/g.52666  ORF Transcript_24130/g.52666 Transcript_24130/m.52666 type:complete len:481 (+) Transcript_24130:2528-3970(+)